MSKTTLLAIILSISSIYALGQNKEALNIYNLKIPSSIESCFSILNKTMSKEEIELIKTLPEDRKKQNYDIRVYQGGIGGLIIPHKS